MAERKIWMRLGVEVTADEDTIKKLLNGDDSSILQTIVKNKQFELVGESYIPSTMIEEYNDVYGEDVEDVDVEYYI